MVRTLDRLDYMNFSFENYDNNYIWLILIWLPSNND